MKKSHIHSAINAASHETSRFMSAHLRAEAHNSGWPAHIVHSLGVSYSPTGFVTHAHDDHKAHVENLEYGTPSTQPTAAIRRFSNRTRHAEDFFIQRLAHHVGDL